jgi:hypothetical protein
MCARCRQVGLDLWCKPYKQKSFVSFLQKRKTSLFFAYLKGALLRHAWSRQGLQGCSVAGVYFCFVTMSAVADLP